MADKRSCPANSHGHTLYRWTDTSGQEWACAAYDHGPFCRLCFLVETESMSDLLDRVEAGELEVHTNSHGGLEFDRA
jgi:hypothetical protein